MACQVKNIYSLANYGKNFLTVNKFANHKQIDTDISTRIHRNKSEIVYMLLLLSRFNRVRLCATP